MTSRICSARTPKTPRDGRLADGACCGARQQSFTFIFLFSFHSMVLFEIRQFGFLRTDADDALLRRPDAIASPEVRGVVCAVAQYAALPRNVHILIAHARRRRSLPS